MRPAPCLPDRACDFFEIGTGGVGDLPQKRQRQPSSFLLAASLHARRARPQAQAWPAAFVLPRGGGAQQGETEVLNTSVRSSAMGEIPAGALSDEPDIPCDFASFVSEGWALRPGQMAV